MQSDDLEDLPFDQYQRYRLVADILDRLVTGPGARAVLDVGGRTGLLRRFLPACRVGLVDLEPSEEAGLILGDGAALPFRDRSFDAVCAFDTLEHVPPYRRDTFVAECARVARRYVVLAGPFQDPRVEEAEGLLLRALRDGMEIDHRYLREHRSNGLPQRARVEERLRSMGGQVKSIGHGRLDRWLISMCIGMYLGHAPTLRRLAREFHRFYNRELYPSDFGDEIYRHVVLAALDGAPLPEDPHEGKPAEEGSGIERILGFVSEMRLLERAREAWAVERDAWVEDRDEWLEDKRQVLATMDDLRADVDGHAGTIETLRADLVEHEKERAELLTDLEQHQAENRTLREELVEHAQVLSEVCATRDANIEEHRRVLAEERADLERHRVENRTLRDDLEEHVRALAAAEKHHGDVTAARKADLSEHRSILAEAREDLGLHRVENRTLRADLLQHRESLEFLRGELEEHRRTKEMLETLTSDMESQLRAADQRCRVLGKSLRSRSDLVTELVRQLRSRPGNLVRAFRPGKFDPPAG